MSSPRTSSRPRRNPFYVLLVISGLAFTITACAYGVLTVKQLRRYETSDVVMRRDEEFISFMRQYGTTLLVGELIALGMLTCAAIGLDRYFEPDVPRSRASSQQHRGKGPSDESEPNPPAP